MGADGPTRDPELQQVHAELERRLEATEKPETAPVFLLGINLEFLEISFIALPMLMPAVAELGIDPIWFLVLMAINLNIAFISPPVGFSLFYLQSVAPPEVKTLDIHRGALRFMGLQGLALVIVLAFPQTVTWLVQASDAAGG